jgi:hypothetical protein
MKLFVQQSEAMVVRVGYLGDPRSGGLVEHRRRGVWRIGTL